MAEHWYSNGPETRRMDAREAARRNVKIKRGYGPPPWDDEGMPPTWYRIAPPTPKRFRADVTRSDVLL